MRDQILEELRKDNGGEDYLPGYNNFEAATYLAPLVEQAIRATVTRAAEAMDWLKLSVRDIVVENNPVNWQTPDGFPVQHRYVKSNGKKFEVWFQGTRMQIQLRVDTKKQDLRKQQSGIAPNYVHSMDACHLRMVVNRMAEEGITDAFAMIHDSFGVHASDVDELHYAIRDEFIRLYTEDQLTSFRNQQLNYMPTAEIPETPTPGSLDLEAIREADFFFS
jgi:DNA-directed RNA polymerase